jgi:hypothetical protein
MEHVGVVVDDAAATEFFVTSDLSCRATGWSKVAG